MFVLLLQAHHHEEAYSGYSLWALSLTESVFREVISRDLCSSLHKGVQIEFVHTGLNDLAGGHGHKFKQLFALFETLVDFPRVRVYVVQNFRNFTRSLLVASSIVHDAANFCFKTLSLQDFVILYFLEVIEGHSLDIGMVQVETLSKKLDFSLAFSQISIVAIVFIHGIILESFCLFGIARNDNTVIVW